MKITEVKISVFELPDVTRRMEMFESGSAPNTRWVSRPHGDQSAGHRGPRKAGAHRGIPT